MHYSGPLSAKGGMILFQDTQTTDKNFVFKKMGDVIKGWEKLVRRRELSGSDAECVEGDAEAEDMGGEEEIMDAVPVAENKEKRG